MTSLKTTCLARGLRLPHLGRVALLVFFSGLLLTGRVRGVADAADPSESASGSPSVPVRADAGPLTDPLPERAVRRFGTARYRHGTSLMGLAVSNDDTFAVTFSSQHRLSSARIYDLRDGRRRFQLPGIPRTTDAVAISPDGKTVATRLRRTIHLFDPKTGVERDKFEVWMGNALMVTHWLTFSPDGTKIGQSSGESEVQLVDLKTKKIVHTFTHSARVYAGVFSPDGKLFAAGDYEIAGFFIRLWDVATGTEVRRFANDNERLNSLAFSPDGKTIVGGGAGALLRTWDVATGEVSHQFEANGEFISSVAFSHDGKTIAAAGETIRLYDAATNRERLRIPHRAVGLHFSPSDEVLTAGVEGTIHRWETRTGKLLTPEGCDIGVEQIDLPNNGPTLVTRDQAGGIHLWDRATGEHILRLKMEDRAAVGVDPQGRYLVLSEDDPSIKYHDPKQNIGVIGGSTLKLYDLENRRYVERFAGFEGDSRGKEFTRDGKTLVTLDHRNGKVRLWDVATGKERRSCFVLPEDELSKPYRITGSELSPDDKTMAVACRRGNNPDGTSDLVALRLWDITTGKELVKLHGLTNNVDGLTFSPDGRLLVSCCQSPQGARRTANEFFVWNVKTGRQLVRLSDKESVSAFSVAFSPDGRTLASASLDGTVRVWEVASWTLRTKFQAHHDHISALQFAPDGTLFTGSFDSTVMAWNVRPEKSPEDMPLPKAWTKLLDLKAETAYAVQGRMLATPNETVAFLAEHLRPLAKVDAKRIKKLLADLDSDDFTTREAAARALREFDHKIEPMLRETLAKTSSNEVRSRVRTLLSRLELSVTPSDELRTLRAIEVLEWLATPSARELLSKLAKGEPNALLTRTSASAVERLLRARGE